MKPYKPTNPISRGIILAFTIGLLVGGIVIGIVDSYFDQPLFSEAQVGTSGGGNASGSAGLGGGTLGTSGGDSASGSAGLDQAKFVAREYDGVDWAGTLSIKNPSGSSDISELITKLINWLLMIIAMVATVVIIYSGLMLVFNSGNETRVKAAKTSLTWAIVGLVVAVSSFALVNIIQTIL